MSIMRASVSEEIPPAQATQAVEPVVIESAGVGGTVALPAVEAEPEEEDKKKRKGIFLLIILFLLLAAAAALEFVPGSPYEHTIRWMIDPPVQTGTQLYATGLEPVAPDCITVELLAMIAPPDGWEYVPEPEPEAAPDDGTEDAASAPEGEEPAEPAGPTASERLRDLKAQAYLDIQAGTLATSPLALYLVPKALHFVPAAPYAYAPGDRAEAIAKAADDSLAARYATIETECASAFVCETVTVETGTYDFFGTEFIFDGYGFVWQTVGIEADPFHDFEFKTDFEQAVLFYHQVDLAALTDDEFSAILVLAGTHADAVSSMRDLALEAAAEPEPAVEPEPEPEPDSEPDDPGSQGGTTPGGSSGGNGGGPGNGGSSGGSGSGNGNGSGNSGSGGTTPGGNSGGGTGSGNGSGNGAGNGNGSGNGSSGGSTEPSNPPAHQHTVASRTWDEQRPVYTHVEGHYETVHHDAVYNDWQEHYTICNDCGAILRTNQENDDHFNATHHSGWHSHTEYHHDLVSEAYDEQVWVAAHDEITGYTWVTITETYCTECGEVLSHSEW